jgi:hypothetical protein
MAVYKFSSTSVKNGRTEYSSFLAGNPAYQPPVYYDSIATTTVGSGGTASVTFNSIPSTYTHLQIRGIIRDTSSGTSARNGSIQLNGSSTGYALHQFQGNGSTVSTDVGTSLTETYPFWAVTGNSTANVFSTVIIDILDYANTNKYKTVKVFGGYDLNGSGHIRFGSILWQNTNAISSIKLAIYAAEGNLGQYSQFALYGIKGA